MKNFNILLMFLVFFPGCKHQEKQYKTDEKAEVSKEFPFFGKKIESNGVKESKEMLGIYRSLAVSDTVAVKFTATVIEVCKAKGCWIKLQLEDGQEAMVRFKDYGFFVPKDIVGKRVIINGLAFVEEMSIEGQRHLADDAGKSETEIVDITRVKKTFGFEADGILIRQ